MEMVLPASYVEVEQEEMMYLDGGNGARELVYSVIAGALGGFGAKAVSASLVGLAVQQAGWATVAAINSMVVLVGVNPAAGVVIGAGVMASIYAVGKGANYW